MSIYKTISDSIIFYRLNGFVYIDAPWTVREDVSNITKPNDRKNFYVQDKALVASGEQSFLELMIDGKLKPGSYVTCTPCFRDERVDDLHKTYFIKTELIVTDNVTEKKLEEVLNLCYEFYSQYLPVDIQPMDDGTYDIVSKDSNIELGSYGIREHGEHKWIYATGCAEPRLSQVISKSKKLGYHDMIIAKRKLGTYGKIFEEMDEFTDALLTGNKIMSLVELSDLHGAIEFYLKENFPGVSMDDLKKMNDVTKRAFANGRRS